MLKLLSAGVLSAACLLSASGLKLVAKPQRISAGESATLEWQAPPSANVVLIGAGRVEPSGSHVVSPAQTQNYTIVAESRAGMLVQSVTVEVSGSRGVDFPTDDSQYRFPLSVERAVQSKAAFLESVHRLLQNDLGFSVKTYSQRNNEVVFLTNSGERGDLVGADERRL